VKAVLDSPLVGALIKEATAKDPSAGLMVGMIRSSVGGVVGSSFSVRDMGKGQNPDVLALVTGPLDDAIAGAIVEGKTQVRPKSAESTPHALIRRRPGSGRGRDPAEQTRDGPPGSRARSQ